MKKTIPILLALMILLTMAACTQTPKEDKSKGTAENEWPIASAEESQYEAETSAAVASVAPADNVAASPSGSYTKYMEMKGTAYDRINAKLEDNEDLYLSVGLSLLPVALVDLSLIPLTVLVEENTGAEMALAMFGMSEVAIDRNGQEYTITYTDQEGNKNAQTCIYDPATDSLQSSIIDSAGKEVVFFEYIKVGNGYASQYFMHDESGYTKITSFFDESSSAAFGIETTDKKPDSIFKTGNQTVDFVKNNEMYFILKGNSLTVSENGQEKTY
ncbi:MAG: hypothetical protein ACOX8Q_01220 [Christensenellales bacterium]|jgi:hypothetical protein